MKKFLIFMVATLMGGAHMAAQSQLTLDNLTGNYLSARTISGIRPLGGSADYSCLSQDRTAILRCRFSTGETIDTLFQISQLRLADDEKIDGYTLSPDQQSLLIQVHTESIYRRSFRADYYVVDLRRGSAQQLSANGPQEVPVWSPDGQQIAFVRDNNIFLKNLSSGQERQITTDGKPNNIINGKPDWVYEEEFSFSSALVFDASGEYLSWLRFDESEVKMYDLQFFKGLKPARESNLTYPSLYSYKYPKAGEQNAKVQLMRCRLSDGAVQEVTLPVAADDYLPRLLAMPFAHEVLVCSMNRHQDCLTLHRVDLAKATSYVILQESSDHYVKEETLEMMQFGEKTFVLPSDRSGFMQLYVYDYQGKLLRAATAGEQDVTAVYGYDEAQGRLFFQAAAPTPTDRQVFMSDKRGRQQLLTAQRGWNTAIFSGDGKLFVHQWSDANHPYRYTVENLKGRVLTTLETNATLTERLADYDLPQREHFQLTTADGLTLNAWMVRPRDFSADKQYPVVMFQYSGPGSQQVVNSWNMGSLGRGALFDCYLAQEGFIVVCVDGRGTGGRGAKWEKSTYLHLGQLEAHDQAAAARWLASQPYVDAGRIGIWGWSYGGFNTLMSLSEPNSPFKAGVAVAPPTDWRFYDTIYTERYMRTPQENPDGYGDNPIARASQMNAALLILHGTADDNVHPQNTYEYAEALVQADKDFREIYYTNRNHSIFGGNTRQHLMRQIVNWFKKEL